MVQFEASETTAANIYLQKFREGGVRKGVIISVWQCRALRKSFNDHLSRFMTTL